MKESPENREAYIDTLMLIYDNRIQYFANGSTEGIIICDGNGEGSCDNQLNQPHGIFVEKEDTK